MLNQGDYNSFSDLFSVCQKTMQHLNLKLWIFSRYTLSFKIGVAKVQDFEILEGLCQVVNLLAILYCFTC